MDNARRLFVSIAVAVSMAAPIGISTSNSAYAQPNPTENATQIQNTQGVSVQSASWGAQTITKANQNRVVTLQKINDNDKTIKAQKNKLKVLIDKGKTQATSLKKSKTVKAQTVKKIAQEKANLKKEDIRLRAHTQEMNSRKVGLNEVADTAAKVGVNLDGFVGLIASTDPVGSQHVASKKETIATLNSLNTSLNKTEKTIQSHTKTLQENNDNRSLTNKYINNLTVLQQQTKKSLPSEVNLDNVKSLSMAVPTFDSVAAVDNYTKALSERGIQIVPASVLNDPNQWPTGYLPVPTANGRWSYGVAQVKTGENDSILIVSKETLDALRLGLQQVGVPYRWGGTTTSGFDCSGLMIYMFTAQNVSLPRVAAAQQNASIKVGKDNLLPGDMIYFGNRAYHVAIYVGEDKNGEPLMLEAPRTGLDVRVTKMRNFTNANRPTI